MYKHDNFMQMAAPIGKSWGIPLWHHHSCACVHVCECVHVCTCMGTPQTPWQSPTPIHQPPPPPGGADPRNQSKVNKNLTNQDISILFEDFKFVEIPPPTHTHTHPPHPTHPKGGTPLICWNVIKLERIKIIQFFLKIYDLLKHPHLWMGEWVGSGQMTNFLKLELIDIIQFCLKTFQITKIK